MGAQGNYSVPKEAQRLLQEGILENPLMKDLPIELRSLSDYVQFEGNDKPSVPINWRFAESISALKGLEAVMVNYLITRKYKTELAKVTINTDHATLFVMSPLIIQYIKEGRAVPIDPFDTKFQKIIPSMDKHGAASDLHRMAATNIYKTKDGRFYHIHGSMNPDPTLTALGLPLHGKSDDTFEGVVERMQNTVSQWDSAALDELMNEKYRQAGTIAWTPEEYFSSEHGKQSGRVGLYEITREEDQDSPPQPACWWPEHESHPSSASRPLAGLKIVDLTRVIAGPAIARGLAELGASVMRVTSPDLADLSAVHHDLNWGKWNCSLDLKDEADKERLRRLILDADVVVDGYRPGVMERLGFGPKAVFDLVRGRGRGIIYARENAYGWHGPWSHRSGWQQISDACCGVSMGYGRAMGNDEAVTPVFPNSDYCTGVCGLVGILDALVKRAESGGSYRVETALNYYSQWLVRSCGTYPEDVWEELWKRHGSPVFRHYHNMPYLLPAMLKLLHQHDKDVLFNQSFFEPRQSKNLGVTFIIPKPIAQFPDGTVELKYQVGTRGNGIDQPFWPRDLKVEVVTGDN